ncbi:MAG TPA: hypothetical protein VGK48_05770 [Terriglobia bacterium]|jgi:hypothetical protein
MKNTRFVSGLEYLLPHGVRQAQWAGLKKRARTPLRLAIETLALLPAEYRKQVVAGFNLYSTIGSVALTVFCFGTSSLSAGKAMVWIAVIGGLQVYDGYRYGARRRKGLSQTADDFLTAGGQGCMALVSVLAAQALMLKAEPSWALPEADLWCGAALCIPLLSVLRLVVMHRPEPDRQPADSAKIPLPVLYKRVRRLTAMWWLTFYFLVAVNVTDIPHYWPDFLRGFCPLATFTLWQASAKIALMRGPIILTLFTSEKVQLERMLANLARELSKGEPLRLFHIAMEGLIYLQIALSMADAVLPWLSDHGHGATLFRTVGVVITTSISVLSWIYVKHAIYAVGDKLQAELEAI